MAGGWSEMAEITVIKRGKWGGTKTNREGDVGRWYALCSPNMAYFPFLFDNTWLVLNPLFVTWAPVVQCWFLCLLFITFIVPLIVFCPVWPEHNRRVKLNTKELFLEKLLLWNYYYFFFFRRLGSIHKCRNVCVLSFSCSVPTFQGLQEDILSKLADVLEEVTGH